MDTQKVFEEFNEITRSWLTQTRVLGVLNRMLPENALVVAAAGSLPGDLQRVWQSRGENDYHVEYGYSCMGYEVNAALGPNWRSRSAGVQLRGRRFVHDAAL